MIEIFEEIPDLLIEAVEYNRYIVEDAVGCLISEDLLVFVNRQFKPADSPVEETPNLATLRRNMNRKKETDNQ